ncbi:MAG: hypothetical protein WBA93_30810 [Microcoleaceae cyanobacterium]
MNQLQKLDSNDLSKGLINSVDIDSYQVEFWADNSISLTGQSMVSPIADNISGMSETKSDKIICIKFHRDIFFYPNLRDNNQVRAKLSF